MLACPVVPFFYYDLLQVRMNRIGNYNGFAIVQAVTIIVQVSAELYIQPLASI